MHSVRLRRLAPVSRFVVAFSFFFSSAAAADGVVSGVVVDPSGAPLPRAFVRTSVATTFADEAGRFRVAIVGECRLEVTLTGFQPSVTTCTPPQPVRVVLALAPIAETVVVTATRTEAPTSQLGASVTAFTAADLRQRQQPLVADLLRSSPGVMVVQSGGRGAVTSLFVRGGESNHNKVLLDGIPLNDPGGTFDFSNITTENLERVEIVRGAQSALFGSDAMASTVQLFTRRADPAAGAAQGTFTIDGGGYGTVHADAAVNGARGPLDYALGVAQYDTDNNVPNDRFDNTTLSANIGIALGSRTEARAVARGELGRVGTPGQTAFGRPDLDAFYSRHDGVFGATIDHQNSSTLRQRASYSIALSDQASTNLQLDPPYTPQFQNRVAPFEFTDFLFDSRSTLRRHHASYQADWRPAADSAPGDQLLTVLADWDGERATLEDRVLLTGTRAARDNLGVSVQHQASWRRTFVTGSARVEHNSSFGAAVVPRASVAFIVRDASGTVGVTKLKASAGLGIKEPTILQSFSLSPFFLGNPDLAPERSRSIEAGVEQRLLGDRAKLETTWFDNRFRDVIATRTTSIEPYRAQYFNIGATRARGAEFAGEIAPAPGVRARAGYTFIDSEILESTSPFDPVFEPGRWAFRRPRHSGYVDAVWTFRRMTADLDGVIVGRFADSDFSALEPPMIENPGYARWDARLSYAVSRRLTATAAVDNLTDRDYMEPLGYPALRRAVRAGLRIAF